MNKVLTIYVWPCGTWCWANDIEEYNWMSDDYMTVVVGNATSDETAEAIANMLTSL